MTEPATRPRLTPDMTMSQVLQACPRAQRALFAASHSRGCRICAFQPGETLAQVCARNDNLDVAEVIRLLEDSQEKDARIQISPAQLAERLRSDSPPRLLDVRTREEHEAVCIPGSTLLTQDLTQEIFASWPKDTAIVLYDHTGSRVLDAAAYFIGHGFAETKALLGGIDAYSREVDPSLPRYRIELET